MLHQVVGTPSSHSSPGLHRFRVESKQTEFGSIPIRNPNEVFDSSYELDIESVLESMSHVHKCYPYK
jgi:hypothetical protein